MRSLLLIITSLALGLPMAYGQVKFIENKGQWQENVRFRADIPQGNLFIENQAITYQFWDKEQIEAHHHLIGNKNQNIQYHAVKVEFLGASPHSIFKGEVQFTEYYNFFLGNDPKKWASEAHAFQNITYTDLYPGIDLLVEAGANDFKYSFIVKPGGDASQIKMHVLGANDVLLDDSGLTITTNLGNIKEGIPYSFQLKNGKESEVKNSYLVTGNMVAFNIGDYDKNSTLTIDPHVVFSSLSGSTGDNWGFTATYDEDGNGYTGGTVYSQDYPVTFGAFQRTFNGGSTFLGRDCGFYKIKSDGLSLEWVTFFGGTDNEQPHSMVVNSLNQLVILGTTESTDLPLQSPFQSLNKGNNDLFIAILNPSGSKLIASSYFGGSDIDGINGEYIDPEGPDFRNPNELVYNYGDLYRGEVVVDDNDDIYFTSCTKSSNFFATTGAYQTKFGGNQDAIVASITANGKQIKWSTFLGGNQIDAGYSLDFDDDNNLYVTGGTKGSFPVTSGVLSRSYGGGSADGYIVHLQNDGSKIINSTYIGGREYDQSFFVKVGPDGNPWVYGQTEGSFPTKNTSGNQSQGMFLTKLNKKLSTILISRIFGSGSLVNISPSAFTVDLCGRVYFSGWGGLRPSNTNTGSTLGLRVTSDAAQKSTDGQDFYIGVYTTDLQTLIYATFWGSNSNNGDHVDGGTSRFDKRGVVYQAICAACGTGKTTFPTFPSNVAGPASNHNAFTNCNNAIVKIDLEGPAIYADFDHTDISCKVPQQVIFTNHTKLATSFTWEMGDGKTYTDSNVTHTFTKPGTYTVKLIAFNPIACNLRDTQEVVLDIYAKSEADFKSDLDYCKKEVNLEHTGDYGKTFNWNFGDGNTTKLENPAHRYTREGRFKITLITDINTECEDTFSSFIQIQDPKIGFDYKVDSCDKSIETNNLSSGYSNFIWDFDDGNTSKDVSPTHQFKSRGKYDVRLVLNVGLECEDTLTKTVNLVDPEAIISFKVDTCEQSAIFSNLSIDAKAYRWTFSDGQNFKDIEPVVHFANEDSNYTFRFIAAPFSMCSDTIDSTLYIPGLPKAEFIFTNDTCLSAAFFNNLSLNSPNFLWYFGNGDSSSAISPYYNYRDTGLFRVDLIAFPYRSCADTFSLDVKIDTFRFAQYSLELDTCSFLINLHNESIDLNDFTWHFGDGFMQKAQETSHEYDEDGNYTIRLFANNTLNGCKDSLDYALFIPPLPKAGLLYRTDSCINTYIFTDTSSFGSGRVWSSGKIQSIEKEFRVSFSEAGTYKIVLISESKYHCLDTFESFVTIDSLPKARFDYTVDSCIGALLMKDNSYAGFRSNWDFGNNEKSNATNPFINYEDEGTYVVSLTINKGTECEDTLSRQVKITEYLAGRIRIGNVFTPNGDGVNDIFEVINLRTDCDQYHLYIYNRWGVLVHHAEGNELNWDGTNGKEEKFLGNNIGVAPGVYFYVFKSTIYETFGTIELVR